MLSVLTTLNKLYCIVLYLMLYISRFTSDMNFFMLALNMSSLHGSKYLNIAISYLVDLVALLAFIWFLPR
jgi:hypothetical protein